MFRTDRGIIDIIVPSYYASAEAISSLQDLASEELMEVYINLYSLSMSRKTTVKKKLATR